MQLQELDEELVLSLLTTVVQLIWQMPVGVEVFEVLV
jgi:hypothetical protein